MDEFGLNLFDDLGIMLRWLIRTTRQYDSPIEKLIGNSVKVYVEFVAKYRDYFYLM